MSVAEMCMLQLMCDKTKQDKVRNENIHATIDVTSIKEEKIAYNNLVIYNKNL